MTLTNLIIGALGLLTAVVCAVCVGYLLRTHLDTINPSTSYYRQIKFPDPPAPRGRRYHDAQ